MIISLSKKGDANGGKPMMMMQGGDFCSAFSRACRWDREIEAPWIAKICIFIIISAIVLMVQHWLELGRHFWGIYNIPKCLHSSVVHHHQPWSIFSPVPMYGDWTLRIVNNVPSHSHMIVAALFWIYFHPWKWGMASRLLSQGERTWLYLQNKLL